MLAPPLRESQLALFVHIVAGGGADSLRIRAQHANPLALRFFRVRGNNGRALSSRERALVTPTETLRTQKYSAGRS
jgi:hypothetical protein